MSREMIVGHEHMTGLAPRNYDELMEVGAEPARHPLARPTHPAAPPATHHATVQHHHYHPAHAPHPGHPARHEGHEPYEPYAADAHYAPPPAPPSPALPSRRRIVHEEPTHERQFPIGFAEDNVQPNDEIDIEVKPQVYFKGERLAIAASVARSFDVVDIKVGKNSQLAATGVMSGEAFSSLAVGTRMELDTAKPGIVITLRVRNVDSTPQNFRAVLYGAVLE